MAFEFYVNKGSTKEEVCEAVTAGSKLAFANGKLEDMGRYVKNISALKIYYTKCLWGNESDIVKVYSLTSAKEVLLRYTSEVSFDSSTCHCKHF